MTEKVGTESAAIASREFETSSAEVSKSKYSLDNEAGDDIYSQANPSRPGFTKHDQKDMYRLGKVQELRVRDEGCLKHSKLLTS
jgi:hypothetical protein